MDGSHVISIAVSPTMVFSKSSVLCEPRDRIIMRTLLEQILLKMLWVFLHPVNVAE